MSYAEHTKVPVANTKNEIKALLKKNKADRIMEYEEIGRAVIVFEAHERRIKFDLPLPDERERGNERKMRQRWRALLLCIKAKMESVESGIESFEEAFLSHVILPDGSTVGEQTRERIAVAYKAGEMRPMLPPPTPRASG